MTSLNVEKIETAPVRKGVESLDLLLFPDQWGRWTCGGWDGRGYYDALGRIIAPTHWAMLPDPNATGGNDQMRALFRQWVAAFDEFDRVEDAYSGRGRPRAYVRQRDAALKRIKKIEQQIISGSESGPAALAARTYLAIHFHWEKYRSRTAASPAADPHYEYPDILHRAALRTAAAIVPEIAELVPPVEAPDAFALGGRQDDVHAPAS